jgi:DNA-binding MarR family transcriptional regulator
VSKDDADEATGRALAAMAAAPVTRISYTVKRLEVAVRARLDAICRDNGVTTMQYVALSVLHLHPGMSSAQLAVRSFVSAQSANQMVAVLEQAGFIDRCPSDHNRRVLRITLSEMGLAVLRSCDAAVDELEKVMLHGLEPAEVRSLRAIMNRCVKNLGPSQTSASPT